MSDRLTSWLRTIVPGLWSTLIAWLATLGLPQSLVDSANGLGELVVVPIVLAVVYAALRWVEPRLPKWLTVLLLGANTMPVYVPQNPDGTYTVTTLGRGVNGIPDDEQRPE